MMATAVGGTHPTGMHSFVNINFLWKVGLPFPHGESWTKSYFHYFLNRLIILLFLLKNPEHLTILMKNLCFLKTRNCIVADLRFVQTK